MGLLKDTAFIDSATAVPALAEVVRESLIRAVFTRDERVLPKELIRALVRGPGVTLRVRDEEEVRRLAAVVNGQESSVSMGLSAEDYHYFRRQLAVRKDQDVGLSFRPVTTTTYNWLVPSQSGIEIDPTGLDEVSVDPAGGHAVLGVGARWKAAWDRAAKLGWLLPFYPAVPIDHAFGDAMFGGDATFASFRGAWTSHVVGVRTIASQAYRMRAGFEQVPSDGTGSDIARLVLQAGSELALPLALAVSLRKRPAVIRNVVYGFEDAAAIPAAIGKLLSARRGLIWMNILDDRSAPLARPSIQPPPFTVEVGLGGPESLVAVQEKATDAAFAGFVAKEALPSVYEAETAAFSAASAACLRHTFVGEVRTRAARWAEVYGKLRHYSETKGIRFGCFTAVRDTGIATLWPFFEIPRDRVRLYDLSQGVWDITKGEPDTIFESKLAQLWSEDRDYLRRLQILRTLKGEVDAASVVEPFVTVEVA